MSPLLSFVRLLRVHQTSLFPHCVIVWIEKEASPGCGGGEGCDGHTRGVNVLQHGMGRVHQQDHEHRTSEATEATTLWLF